MATRIAPSLFPRAWLAALTALMLASCGGGGGDSGITIGSLNTPVPSQQASVELADAFAATLTASEQVPSNTSNAEAAGTVVVNPVSRQMLATVTAGGVTAVAVNIEEGARGVNGPIVVALTESAPGSGEWTARAVLTDAQYGNLKAGNYYFNLRSTLFPNGEIRGQIEPPQATASFGQAFTGGTGSNSALPISAFLASLKGANVAPPTTSAAQAAASMLADPSTRAVTIAIVTTGIQGSAAHIHAGGTDVNGPAIVALAETPAGGGIWTARAVLTDVQFNALLQGNLYVDVESAAFPGGEVRGQLLPQAGNVSTPVPTGGISTGTPFPIATGTLPPITPTVPTGITGTPIVPTADTGISIPGAGIIPGTNPLVTIPSTPLTPAGGIGGIDMTTPIPASLAIPGAGNTSIAGSTPFSTTPDLLNPAGSGMDVTTTGSLGGIDTGAALATGF